MQQTKDQEWLLVDGGNLEVSVTREADAVEEAQRLRFDIFGREMGAGIHGENGRDIDHYDEFCRHLIVRDKTSGRIIGTYRLITEEAAKAAGGWYSDSEFDLSRIRHILPKTVELGRACVHKDYRTGGTISLLWMGLIGFMQAHGLEYMIGCGSVHMDDGGDYAASLFNQLKQTHYSPEEYRVFPKVPLPLNELRQDLEVEAPPLMKGYLRAGVWICGEPHWDKDFGSADMLVMMPMANIHPRYAKHFVK